MRDRGICGVGRVVLWVALIATLPIIAEPPLFADLSAVQGIAHYTGPDAGKDLLAKNGFVVTQEFQRHIFLPYLNDTLPHFVTADSIHRTFHVLLEDHLKLVETNAAVEVTLLLSALRGSLEAQPPDAVASGALAPLAAEARTLALAFLQVAEVLLTSESIPPDLPEAVAAEVAAILNAGGFGSSPLFVEEVDYSQFKPRGFYTESPELERYFRTMSWFGNSAFLLGNDVQTLSALMLSKALQDTPEAQQRWRKLDTLYTRFLGPCDDLTPEEYGAELPDVGVLDSPAALEGAILRLRAELRDPRINSMLTSAEKSQWVARTKGMRFMGKRYLPDSEIFLALVTPEVAGRTFPSGLDLMAANGSARAAALMASTPEGSQPNYIAAAAKSREIVSAYKRESNTHYGAILRLAETLTAPPVAQAAPFARTAAYGEKNLMTSLAAWASTRHTWALHAKQPNLTMGSGPLSPEDPPPGYVEPNPAFFAQMSDIVIRTTTLFEDAGLEELDQFKQFESVVGKLAELVRKELAGEPFSEDERQLLAGYGNILIRLHGMEGGGYDDERTSWMSLVMDVYTNADSEQCLEVATGGAMPIYVILEHGGKPHLLIGSVYSYYEFLQPISARLTDEEWRGQWDEGRVPELPAWSGSFVAGGHDVAEVIARLRNGEIVSGLEFIQDPALDAYLVENVGPDSPSWDKENVAYVFHAASRRAPEVVNPILVHMIRTGELDSERAGKIKASTPEVATAALTGNVREEDLPELLDIMATTDAVRAEFVRHVLIVGEVDQPDTVAIQALGRCVDPILKCNMIDFIGGIGASIDITPEFLKRASKEQGAMKLKCLLRLSKVWRRWSWNASGYAHVTSTASDAERKLWSAQLDTAILEALAAFDWVEYSGTRDMLRRESKTLQERAIKDSESLDGLYEHASRAEHRWVRFQTELLKEIAEATGARRLEGAVPFLEEALRHADSESTEAILSALVSIGSDEAVYILAKSMGSSQMDLVLRMAHDSYMGDNGPETNPLGGTLIKLLEDTSAFGEGGLRICDITLKILADSFNEIHPGPPLTSSLADRDAKVAEWIAHLQARSLPSDYEEEARGFARPGAPGGLSAPAIPGMRSDEE